MQLPTYLKFDFEKICVTPEGEPLPHFIQPLFVQSTAMDLLFGNSVIVDLPQGADDHRVPAMIDIVPVDADPVDTDDITLVLNGPGLQEGLPGEGPAFGPVGNIDDAVVFERRFAGLGLPAPDRKPEVIADEEQHPPAIDRSDQPPVARGIV